MPVPVMYCTHTGTGTFHKINLKDEVNRKVVAKAKQNADDDASLNTNPSTGKGMCQYAY